LNHPIVRLFGTAQQAADAIAKLKKEGYTDDLITLVSPAAHQGKDAIASAIAAGYVLKSLAVEYAEGVLKGHSLVIVRAPFGAGGKTEKILDSAQPIDSGVSIPADRAALWDEAAPIIFRVENSGVVAGAVLDLLDPAGADPLEFPPAYSRAHQLLSFHDGAFTSCDPAFLAAAHPPANAALVLTCGGGSRPRHHSPWSMPPLGGGTVSSS
jgi:hypothetical protein